MIYILDKNSKFTAQYLDDRSLDRMIKDLSRVLCLAHWDIKVLKYFDENKIFTDGWDNLSLETKNAIIEIEKTIPFDIKCNELSDRYCPWSYWSRQCIANYRYLVGLAWACCDEYLFRSCKCVNCRGNNCPYRYQNKHYSVIEWARDNEPDLPHSISTECTRCLELMSSTSDNIERLANMYHKEEHITSFPLVMPEKYKRICDEVVCYCSAYRNSCAGSVYESYRNYYRSRLEKARKRKVKCKECDGTGDGMDCFCCDYGSCNDGKSACCGGLGYIIKSITPTWTRRQRPEFLADL